MVKKSLRLLLQTCIYGLFAVTTAGFLGKWLWILELTSHFRMQYVWIGIILLVYAIASKKYALISFATAAVCINLSLIAPLYMTKSAMAMPSSTLSIVSTNVEWGRADANQLGDFAAQHSADVIFMAEATQDLVNRIQTLHPEYSYAVYHPIDNKLGLALLSKDNPISEVELIWQQDAHRPLLRGDFQIHDQIITIIGLHPHPPTNARWANYRNTYFHDVETYVESIHNPIIMVGDFNTTSWSPYFTELEDQTDLHDSREGFGLSPSWPSWLPPFMRIPIDHALLSSSLVTQQHEVGPDVGSDHLPIFIKVGL
ncbi:endonuclease/exonuclease/phosphatase family protein [candidate division WWE3 bacterium]|nr:endonuclease/exonuclease/phosphatase family protein [candidate division WWE3 bacterium]